MSAHLKKGFFICTLASMFYVYDFIIRVVPGTIAEHIMSQYQVSSAGLGLLSAFFFLGYMPMQIPCGLLYDYYGPRILLTLMTLLAAVATYFFISTHYFSVAAVSRFLMGFGSAFAYIGALVLASRWLPLKYFALFAGLIQFMGSIGAIAGEAPLAKLVQTYNPHDVLFWVMIVGIILAISFWFLIKDFPSDHVQHIQKPSQLLIKLKKVLANKQNWAAAIYGFAIWAPIAVFSELWAIPYLGKLYAISNTEAALLASFLWVGVALGGPFFGWLSTATNTRLIPLKTGSIIGILSALIILYLPLPKTLMPIFLFLFGVGGSVQAVTFGVIQDNNPLSSTGTATGFNNMAIVLGGTFFQPLVGYLIHYHSHSILENGVPVYRIEDYRFALIILPMCFILTWIMARFFIRETNLNHLN